MEALAAALLEVESTRARTEKTAALARALARVAEAEPAALPFAVRFVTGAPIPASSPRPLGVGWALVTVAIEAATGLSRDALVAAARRAGDMGTAAHELLEGRERERAGSVSDAMRAFDAIAGATSRRAKALEVTALLRRGTPGVVRYLVRALQGEMRVGAKGGVVEDAIARAFDATPEAVSRAAAILGDLGDTADLARRDALAEATPRIGAPLDFMLATPIEIATGDPLATGAWVVEEKVDGIRAQLHVGAGPPRLFARGKGDVTRAFPEIAAAAGALDGELILDGEIVVVGPGGRPRPFSALQRRLGRVAPPPTLREALPVRYLAYDAIVADGRSLLDAPFASRRAELARLAQRFAPPLSLHTSRPLSRAADVDPAYAAAREGGFEGLVLKRADAPYAAGTRGRAWLKVKRALTTLDVVVVAAERGHGKRAGVLSDYTFAVRDAAGALRVVGKAYTGLTDAEIAALTQRLEASAIAPEARGRVDVRPEIVLEIAFDGVQRSPRHDSGFSLRFPRIARVRDDKTPDRIDTLEAVAALFEAQVETGHREEPEVDEAPGAPGGPRAQLSLFSDEPTPEAEGRVRTARRRR